MYSFKLLNCRFYLFILNSAQHSIQVVLYCNVNSVSQTYLSVVLGYIKIHIYQDRRGRKIQPAAEQYCVAGITTPCFCSSRSTSSMESSSCLKVSSSLLFPCANLFQRVTSACCSCSTTKRVLAIIYNVKDSNQFELCVYVKVSIYLIQQLRPKGWRRRFGTIRSLVRFPGPSGKMCGWEK